MARKYGARGKLCNKKIKQKHSCNWTKRLLDKAQNGIKGNISENWTQKWTAGPVHL